MKSSQEVAQKYTCNYCDYKSSKKCNLIKHFLTDKHILKSQSIQTNLDDFRCDICNYSCKKASNYNKHINTKKHIKNVDNVKNNINLCECECGKKYKNTKILYYHKKRCILSNKKQEEQIKKETNDQSSIIGIMIEEIKNMMIENKEFKNMLTEQNKMMIDIANKPSSTNNITNNKVSNQQFNMNVFLNETCKDAMNMSEFIENLQVSMEDMEKTGELGFAKGMSRIIMNNLNAIDVCKRPIHCSDVKRETLYVKNNGVWEKETEERKRTKEVIYKISSLNVKQLLKWRDLPRNKGYEKSDHKKNDEFTKLVMEVNKLREEEIDKVITNISKHVAIDKDKEKVKMSGYLN
jgi:hypothetical protein